MYDPSIGRWMNEDPIRLDSKDPNFYRYVGNEPLDHTDPTGLDAMAFQGGTKVPENDYGGGELTFPDGKKGKLSIWTGITSYLSTEDQARNDAISSFASAASPIPFGPLMGIPLYAPESFRLLAANPLPNMVHTGSLLIRYDGDHSGEMRLVQTGFSTVRYKMKDKGAAYLERTIQFAGKDVKLSTGTDEKQRNYFLDVTPRAATPYAGTFPRPNNSFLFMDSPNSPSFYLVDYYLSLNEDEKNALEDIVAVSNYKTTFLFNNLPVYSISWSSTFDLKTYLENKPKSYMEKTPPKIKVNGGAANGRFTAKELEAIGARFPNHDVINKNRTKE